MKKTGHIDLFIKFVGQNIVLIGDFSKDQARLVKLGADFDANVFARHLTSVQEKFSRLGYQVVKVPMPIPSTVRYHKNDQLEPWEIKEVLIRSYLNSLLLNRDGRRIALVPRFEKQKIRHNNNVKDDSENSDSPPKDLGSIDYPDRELIPNYEATVTEAYKKAGYEVQFILSDHLVASSGAIHCLTMQIPQKMAP